VCTVVVGFLFLFLLLLLLFYLFFFVCYVSLDICRFFFSFRLCISVIICYCCLIVKERLIYLYFIRLDFDLCLFVCFLSVYLSCNKNFINMLYDLWLLISTWEFYEKHNREYLVQQSNLCVFISVKKKRNKYLSEFKLTLIIFNEDTVYVRSKKQKVCFQNNCQERLSLT
jgi:hypothetical protein